MFKNILAFLWKAHRIYTIKVCCECVGIIKAFHLFPYYVASLYYKAIITLIFHRLLYTSLVIIVHWLSNNCSGRKTFRQN